MIRCGGGEREGGRKGVSLTDGSFDFFYFLPKFDSSRTSESERSVMGRRQKSNQ